jgi:hypothetical protein
MSTLNISLPGDVKKWAEHHAKEKGYGTTDKFVLEILRREQALEEREKIEQILLDAVSSGKPSPMTRTDWDRIRANGLRRAQERRKK